MLNTKLTFSTPVQISSSTACKVHEHEVFKGSSRASDRDGRCCFFLFLPQSQGVGKGSVENREQTIEALQQFAVTFLSELSSILSLERHALQPGTQISLLAVPMHHM